MGGTKPGMRLPANMRGFRNPILRTDDSESQARETRQFLKILYLVKDKKKAKKSPNVAVRGKSMEKNRNLREEPEEIKSQRS